MEIEEGKKGGEQEKEKRKEIEGLFDVQINRFPSSSL
jgi:hypothetical protein